MRLTRTSLAKAAIAIAGAAAMLVVSPVPAAQAADNCNQWTQFPNGEGAGTMEVTANLKTGPYASCGNVRSVAAGTRLYFYCAVKNSYGNFWFYVRVGGTSTYGWMSRDNLISEDYWDEDGDGAVSHFSCLY